MIKITDNRNEKPTTPKIPFFVEFSCKDKYIVCQDCITKKYGFLYLDDGLIYDATYNSIDDLLKSKSSMTVLNDVEIIVK